MQIFIVFTFLRVASRQRGKFEILVFLGGPGDAKFHSMYIVSVFVRKPLKPLKMVCLKS